MAKLIKGRHKSAIKAHRQSAKARIKNLDMYLGLKKTFKNLKKAIEKKDIVAAKKHLAEYYSACDRASKINFIHFNNAARKKSHAARIVSTLAPA